MTAPSPLLHQVRAFVPTLLDLGRHPNMRIVRELIGGARRYNELLLALPELAEPIVGGNLRELDAAGIVVRRVDPGPPLRVLYELTPFGVELAPCLAAIESYAQRMDRA